MKLAVFGWVAFAALAAGAENIVPNPGVEAMGVGAKTAGWRIPAPYRVIAGEGRDGSRGIVWTGTDPKVYTMPKIDVDLKPGQRYRFGGWTRIKSLNGPKAASALYLEWYGADGKWLGGCQSSVAHEPGDWMHLEGESPVIPAEAKRCCLMGFATKGATGEVAFDDFSVTELTEEPLGEVWTSAYRNTAVDGTVKLLAELNPRAPEWKADRAKAVFRIPDGKGNWRELPTKIGADGDLAGAKLDVSGLPRGLSPINFVLTTGGVYRASKTILFNRIDSFPRDGVRFDGFNRTIVNGEPFYPLGMYAGVLTSNDIARIAESPFNCLMSYRMLPRHILDYGAERGVKFIVNIKDSYAGSMEWHPPWIVDDATETAWTAERVSALRDHPAVLAWYICDEQEVSMVPRIRARRELVEKLDPKHPVWIVLYQAPQIRSYMGAFDVIGTDPYPITDLGQYPGRKDGIGRVAEWTRQTREGVFGMRPLWQVPQCFDWAIIGKSEEARMKLPSRPPTREEIRNMTWQSIAAGGDGIVYYAYHELWRMDAKTPFAKSFADVCAVAKEVEDFRPALLSEPGPRVRGVSKDLCARTWTDGKSVWLLAVNASEDAVSGTLEFAGRRLDVSLGRLEHLIWKFD